MAIEIGTLVKVSGTTVHIKTVNPTGRVYERDKKILPGRPIFGTVKGVYCVQKELTDDEGNVVQPGKFVALVRWDGKYRTSILPVEVLKPAINQAKRGKK